MLQVYRCGHFNPAHRSAARLARAKFIWQMTSYSRAGSETLPIRWKNSLANTLAKVSLLFHALETLEIHKGFRCYKKKRLINQLAITVFS